MSLADERVQDHLPNGWGSAAWHDLCWTEAAATGEPVRATAERLRLYIDLHRERYGYTLWALSTPTPE